MVRVSTVTSLKRERDERRLAAQQLIGPPAGGVAQVVDRLLAVQAQDLRAARLAIRARSRGLTAAEVDRALQNRTLVVTWLNRGTLHLVRAQDYWWLQRLTTAQLSTGNARRLEQEGVFWHECGSPNGFELGFLLLRQRFWAGAAGLWLVPVLRRFCNGSRQFG